MNRYGTLRVGDPREDGRDEAKGTPIQPTLSHRAFSPKAVLAWTPSDAWLLKASAGVANRFPTVTELYQAVTTGSILSVPNPTLLPDAPIEVLEARTLFKGASIRRHGCGSIRRLGSGRLLMAFMGGTGPEHSDFRALVSRGRIVAAMRRLW